MLTPCAGKPCEGEALKHWLKLALVWGAFLDEGPFLKEEAHPKRNTTTRSTCMETLTQNNPTSIPRALLA